MKIADNYLILLRDAAINPNQEEVSHFALLKSIFIFERWDFVNAVRICEELIDLRLISNEKVLKHYKQQLESFDNGFFPEYDYFEWKEKFVAQLVYGKQRKTKEKIEEEIRVGMYEHNLEFALDIKNLISCIVSTIVMKTLAKKEIEEFAKRRLEPNSLDYLLEMVEYNAP